MRPPFLFSRLDIGCNPGAAQTGDRVVDTGSFRDSRPYQPDVLPQVSEPYGVKSSWRC